MRFGPALQLGLALVLAACSAPPPTGFLGAFRWQMEAPWFGGLSGLEVSPDGRRLIAISDRGTLVTARIDRRNDRIVALRDVEGSRLRGSSGAPLVGLVSDSEGLAVAPDGAMYVSFEQVHRVARYGTRHSAARVLPRPAGFRALEANTGLEALAIDPAGRLVTLPEKGRTRTGAIPVWRWDGTAWSMPFTLPARGSFLPVGADFGPDGRFYLLERDYGPFGFRSRLRRWDLSGDVPVGETTLVETRIGTHDNLEGVSIWRDSDGHLRATMISDDNFMPFQQTELVEYALPD